MASVLPIKLFWMLFYMKQSFATITSNIFLPLYKTVIRLHLEYANQVTHPIPCRDTEVLEKVQMFALTFVKGLRHVPYVAIICGVPFSLVVRLMCLGTAAFVVKRFAHSAAYCT